MRFIHAADFHLDSPFSALSPEKAKERRRESRELIGRLCALVREEQADVLLLAGDLVDERHVYPETVETLAGAFRGIDAQVFIAPGNHDPYEKGCIYDRVQWPENVHIFKSTAMESVELAELNAVIHGTAFTSPERWERPIEGFTVPADGRCHIILCHGDIAAKESPYGAITKADIAASGADYLALGHIHTASEPKSAGKTAYAYPGVPEGRGFDEIGEKGVLIGSIENGELSLAFHPIASRRYMIVTADVTETPALTAAQAALQGYEKDIVRLIFTGQSRETLPLQRLYEQLSGSVYALELRDETETAKDVWERRGEDSLRGIFLREMERKLRDASPEEKQRITEALRFGLAALDGRDL